MKKSVNVVLLLLCLTAPSRATTNYRRFKSCVSKSFAPCVASAFVIRRYFQIKELAANAEEPDERVKKYLEHQLKKHELSNIKIGIDDAIGDSAFFGRLMLSKKTHDAIVKDCYYLDDFQKTDQLATLIDSMPNRAKGTIDHEIGHLKQQHSELKLAVKGVVLFVICQRIVPFRTCLLASLTLLKALDHVCERLADNFAMQQCTLPEDALSQEAFFKKHMNRDFFYYNYSNTSEFDKAKARIRSLFDEHPSHKQRAESWRRRAHELEEQKRVKQLKS